MPYTDRRQRYFCRGATVCALSAPRSLMIFIDKINEALVVSLRANLM